MSEAHTQSVLTHSVPTRRVPPFLLLATGLLSITLLTGCGKKGPLYIPQAEESATQTGSEKTENTPAASTATQETP
ncbi:lipoprotein [Thiomicrorhabdus sp. zzn3]|uniref:LPS translocon maturation chaperone LptM n=1 Tax=Thiomicrorhabdus sp. zzn3 TaxID=3039775 RepID=UPI0024365BED|nr:lipoprotein [Thiomicrorhabdus sp. zzn3]MDG6777187.1 lipoprotein [Thiomicrorhabdus sp. zzn3]